jgi:hypothetical protein
VVRLQHLWGHRPAPGPLDLPPRRRRLCGEIIFVRPVYFIRDSRRTNRGVK